MLITASIDTKGYLVLLALSYNKDDFVALEKVLETAGISPSFRSSFSQDKNDTREGREYRVDGRYIGKLASVLDGDFDKRGQFQAKKGGGQTYACREVNLRGQGKGCAEFLADDDYVAKVKCGLIAGRKKWFGGVSEPGACGSTKPRGILSRIFG